MASTTGTHNTNKKEKTSVTHFCNLAFRFFPRSQCPRWERNEAKFHFAM